MSYSSFIEQQKPEIGDHQYLVSSKITIKQFAPAALLLMYLIYPLFYVFPIIESIGYSFELFYFLTVIPIHFFLFFLYRKINVKIWFFVILGLFLLFLFVQTSNLQNGKPFLFFFFIISLIPFNSINPNLIGKIVYIIVWVNLSISFILLFFPGSYFLGRFTGYGLSPTTYCVFIEVVLVLALFYIPKRKQKIIIYFAILFFVFLTKTRINLAFGLLLPFLYLIIKKGDFPKKTIFIGFIIGLNVLYPIYELISQSTFAQSMVEERYGDTRDASFGLRAILQQVGIEKLVESSTTEFLFGHGSEYSRLMIEDKFGADIHLHNDFIRLALDFGILFPFLYLIFLYKIARKNNAAFLLLFLYLFSFYHNMVYSFFFIGIIYLLGRSETLSNPTDLKWSINN